MARCQNCNKFSALNFEEPELSDFSADLDLDPDSGDLAVHVRAEMRLVRTSECCGDEMKTADLEVEEDVVIACDEISQHLDCDDDGKWSWKAGHEPEANNDDPEQVEEGGGRYAKSYFGASVHYTINCNGNSVHEGTLTDKVAASAMDACC